MYTLLQYYGGDTGIDIVSDNSKRKLNKQRRQLSSNTLTLSEQAGATDITFQRFCTERITEMRNDRDMMSREISDMKAEIIATKAIQKEVRGLRTDFKVLLERVNILVYAQSCQPKPNQSIELQRLVTDNTNHSEEILNMHNMVAGSTSRINNLEVRYAVDILDLYLPLFTPLQLDHSLFCQPAPMTRPVLIGVFVNGIM